MSDDETHNDDDPRVDFIREGVRRRRATTRSGQLEAALRESAADMPDDEETDEAGPDFARIRIRKEGS